MTKDTRYTATAIALHWLMAVLLFGLFAVGVYMTELPLSPRKLQIYSWHKWAGVTAFVLVLVRLAWRAGHRPPPLPDGMSALERLGATAAHGLLYLLMLAIPLSGWLMSSAKGFQTVWFGVLPIPDLLGKNEFLGDLLQGAHVSLNYLLLLVVLVHAVAALKHHLVNRDDVLVRMLPAGTPRN
ncbi:cytochrome b [Pseudothauera rhizosphaerae]|uniref:Cytochrome b n=1 Tax=Pseudothauera rhizosphaerae TaxID=2565932 RepID=A0A4S4A984_9RHOO|nr:cytochrome b [Pseudothauera rhizosphaerae]THF55387.1 cytochrome b [Pseudothauera rhizosphaerae]